MFVHSSPTDGRGFEAEFCGCSFYDIPQKFRKLKVRSLKDGFTIVKGYQALYCNWNPRKPSTPLSISLFNKVAKGLPKGNDELRLFLSIGTFLDLRGIDFFFEYCGAFATVDLTVSKNKKRAKANFVISHLDFLKDRHYNIGSQITNRLSPRKR